MARLRGQSVTVPLDGDGVIGRNMVGHGRGWWGETPPYGGTAVGLAR
ncbi:hypothetical protein [Pararhodobacter zhoushanensis]|nr:hypothetical protein [Pararhodobacter zhoushanensis]